MPGHAAPKPEDCMTRVHCIVARDIDTNAVSVFMDAAPHDMPAGQTFAAAGDLDEGIRFLNAASVRAGHNILGFDEVALAWIGRTGLEIPKGKLPLRDTLVGARVVFPEEHMKRLDYARSQKDTRFPKQLIGRHSLASWGWRLGERKGDFKGPWKVFTRQMLEYCIQDTATTLKLYRMLENKVAAGRLSWRAWGLEQEHAARLANQQRRGFVFKSEEAMALSGRMVAAKAELESEVQKVFPPFVIHYVTPKKRIKKTKIEPFNPNSRVHIAKAFVERFGWKPDAKQMRQDGRPKVDEKILSGLSFPGVEQLRKYLKLKKLLGMVAEGKKSWLNLVKPDGRIYGRVNHNGAVTGRCTHSSPNVTQVPKVRVDEDGAPIVGLAGHFGWDCRNLYTVPDDWSLVGGDASGIELRILAHYMAKYDGGAYIKVILEGDVHSVNRDALGLPADKSGRERAKRFIYAWLYGAGDAKLGIVLGCSKADARRFRLRFLKNLPALARLKQDIAIAAMRRGCLKTLDGRYLWVRSPHAALNTLLQGGGAIVMKLAGVLYARRLADEGRIEFKDWAQVLMAHDEFQIESRRDHAQVGEAIRWGIQEAGRRLKVRCPLDGEWKVGRTWAETH